MTFEEILKQPLPSKMIDDELYVCEMPERDFNLGNKIENWNASPEGSQNIVDINKMPDYTKMTKSITER